MGWKDNARRLVTGDRIDLETFEGYWIQPKKYSIQAKDEINSYQRKIQKGIDKKSLSSLMQRAMDCETDDAQEMSQELMASMTADEMSALIDSQNVEAKDMTRVKILHGVASHNFCEGESSTDTKQFSIDILEYEDIALEILSIVEGFNRPLAKKTSSTLETLPNGSTEAQVSSTEMSIQTEENQQS